jgi:4-aminobutyrate aminotransferase/(S)-3-amino-2-methylpropionate transaminase
MTITHAESYASVAARERYVPRGLANTHSIFVARAEGTRVWDVDGKEYLDFTSGIGVLNTGHRHPRVVRAVHEQVDRLMHTCFQVAMYEPYVELAARLCRLVGDDRKAILFTTGAEAIENAVKIARAHTKRPGGRGVYRRVPRRTLLSLTMTSSSPAYRQNFGPFASEVYHSPFPDEYRGWTTDKAIDALQELFDTRVTAENVAAVVIEPQLGEGGFVPAPVAFLQRLRELTERSASCSSPTRCRPVSDGPGRCSATSTPGSNRISSRWRRASPPASRYRRSSAGRPSWTRRFPAASAAPTRETRWPCAAALAVLDVFESEALVARAAERFVAVREALKRLQARVPAIGDVRGLGCMLAMEFVKDRGTKEPDADLAQRVIEGARSRGLLLLKCGPHKNVVRLLAPLTATVDELAKGVEILEAAVHAAAG